MTMDLMKKLHDENVDLNNIFLDPRNPRLLGKLKGYEDIEDEKIPELGVQDSIIKKILEENLEIEELKSSIAEVGFLTIDRVIVRPLEMDSGFVVIEGNRRISACKRLMEELNAKEREINEDLIDGIRCPRVLVFKVNKEEAEHCKWILQGLRHISGPKGWGPYQQARAVEVLLDIEKMEARDVADTLGIGVKIVNRLYKSLKAFKQFEGNEDYGKFALPEMFSYFEEIMKKPYLRDDFLGWDEDDMIFTNSTNLEKMFIWITPDEGTDTKKIPGAMDIRKLEQVLRSPTAYKILEEPAKTIDDADRLIGPTGPIDWESALKEAIQTLINFPPDDLESLSDEKKGLLMQIIELATKRMEQAEKLSKGS